MTLRSKRVLAAMLAVAAALVGVWAAAFPLSFYTDFPVAGWHWVSLLGPYNEHLTRDVGATNLALLVLTVWVWRRPTAEKLRMTGGAWLAYSSIHFLWHMLHLGVFTTWNKAGNAVSLGLILAFSIALLLPDRPAEHRPTAEPGLATEPGLAGR